MKERLLEANEEIREKILDPARFLSVSHSGAVRKDFLISYLSHHYTPINQPVDGPSLFSRYNAR